MMFRKNNKLEFLDGLDNSKILFNQFLDKVELSEKSLENKSGVSLLLSQANINLHPKFFIMLALITGSALSLVLSQFFSYYFVPIFFIAGFFLPFSYLEYKINKRSNTFAEDYAEMLMAMASSIKIGMTIDKAFERSVSLYPEKSLVKQEVRKFLHKIDEGHNREDAIACFAESIRLPELVLFRSAYLLVNENGGRFAPTLSRLADVTKERLSLISSAQVSTATMRMTANFLLFFTPLMVILLSRRTEDYWQLMLNNPQINMIASFGIMMIFGGYCTLRIMSNFKA